MLFRRVIASIAFGLSVVPLGAAAQTPPMTPNYPMMVKGAVSKSLPLLQHSAMAFTNKSTCVSCHNQTLPSMAVYMARQRGFKVDAKIAKEQTEAVYNFLARFKPVLQQAMTDPKAEKALDAGTVDPSISVGYLLYGLAFENWKSDETTELAAAYLAKKQEDDGRWPILEARPPLESSDFTATALAVRVLQTYGAKSRADEWSRRIDKAREWMIAAKPKTTEDKTFRLLGLKWTNAGDDEIRRAVNDLLADQHDEGEWAQQPNMAGDAYATGQVLVALHLGGNVPTTHPAYQRGYKYLLKTQKQDGSWFVAKRAVGVQTYFDSEFSHGQAQYISVSGSSWATIALTLALDQAVGGIQSASAARP